MMKPKLVFFQWTHEGSAKFLHNLKRQHVNCLSEFFEVTVINEECDYQQVCDKYQPDITLFESGVASYNSRRSIKNTSAYPEIPKLGFYNGDACCGFHAAFLSDMENWGIETFFSISLSFAEYLPEITDNLFFWPNFIVPDVFRDYRENKNIPVIITGSQSSLYPWRSKVAKVISQHYPSLVCPHLGYLENRETSRMMFGEQYARALNASWFSPACCSMSIDLVRKVLEIPGSKSCLITEKNPIIEAAGFADMENCIFVDENDVLDKLDYLFENREKLEKIINAGHDLVHSQHTYKQRDQIWQWFNLHKQLKPNQRIVQRNPFEPMTVVESSSDIKNLPIAVQTLDRIYFCQGDEHLWTGNYDAAEALYIKCLNYVGYQAQPKLRLALCNLYKGNAAAARYWIEQPIQWTLDVSKELTPDPVEWAYLIIALLCQGKVNDAVKHVNQYPLLHHPELDRTRWVVNTLTNKNTLPYSEQSNRRYSVHQLPILSFKDWIENLRTILKASQQLDLAENLSKLIQLQEGSLKTKFFIHASLKSTPLFSSTLEAYKVAMRKWATTNLKPTFRQTIFYLEARFGYFLPYRISSIRFDEFFQTIQSLLRGKDVKTALIIGASAGEGSTEAFLMGIRENLNKPSAFCMNLPTPDFKKLQKYPINESDIEFYDLPCLALKEPSEELSANVKQVKQENKIIFFDFVLVDGSELIASIEESYNDFHGAKFILLDDINEFKNHQIYQKLLSDVAYTVLTQNLDLRNGYAVFEKIT